MPQQTRQSHTFFPDEALKRDYIEFVQTGRMYVYEAAGHGAGARPSLE